MNDGPNMQKPFFTVISYIQRLTAVCVIFLDMRIITWSLNYLLERELNIELNQATLTLRIQLIQAQN